MAKGGRISQNAWERVRKVVLDAERAPISEFVPKRPKIFGSTRPFQTFLVQLTTDGGTGAIASPFTYTAKDYATGVGLLHADGSAATGLSPVFPSSSQSRVVTAATAGLACRDENGDWLLILAGGVFGKGACP